MRFLNCSCGTIDDGYIYYNDIFLSAICKMNSKTHYAYIVHETNNIYETAIKTKNEILFFAEDLEDILCLKANSGTIEHFNIKDGSTYRISRVFVDDKHIIVVPHNIDRGLVLIDVLNHTYEESIALNSIESLKELKCINYPTLCEGEIVFSEYGGNNYYELDYYNMTVVNHRLTSKVHLSAICHKKEKFFATQVDTTGILTINKDEVVEYDLLKNSRSFEQAYSCFVSINDDMLVILPALLDELYVIDGDVFKKLTIPNKCKLGMASKSLYCEMDNGNLWIFPYRKGGAFYCCNLQTDDVEKVVPNYTNPIISEKIFSTPVMEQETADLPMMIMHLLGQ